MLQPNHTFGRTDAGARRRIEREDVGLKGDAVDHADERKNGRYFSSAEKRRAMLDMLAVDLGIQALFSLLASASQGELPLAALALALGVIGALHALVIYVFVGLAGRQYARSQSRA